MPPPTQPLAPLGESRVYLGAALVCVHMCVGAENLASSWVRTAGCSGYGRGPQPLRGEGAQSRPCPPRRRSRVSISHLSDRYKAESSRMNLGGNGAEKGREPLQAAAPKELAGVGLAHRDRQRGHQQGVPSPQETGAGSSLASVFLSVQGGRLGLESCTTGPDNRHSRQLGSTSLSPKTSSFSTSPGPHSSPGREMS